MRKIPFVETHVDILIPSDRDAAFALMSDLDQFPTFFTGFGPIPKVVRCELVSPLPVAVGSKRLISNGDGSVLEEIVEIHEDGKEQRYRIEKGFVPPFSFLIAAAVGHWTFESEAQGTRVGWTYRFELTSSLARPIAGFIVHVFFKRAMMRCLGNMRQALS
ncbi:MAG: SRPBCC family protein [Deltaproteobacteria bacterium]|jgi:ribosome-associated toxin RatA of RatAB toxin-antitoxin module|nr:SRPBCC family protein [Deltaproteobacteria bacterium]MBT6431778.1 SRPBCC family protein [Deltaproteobacteria bacterium]MBT6490357.1 SRPBCC family protein [Deltaproteobacteria bacterium]